MRIALIGRTEILLGAGQAAIEHGHKITYVLTAREAPEYTASISDFKKFAAENSAMFSVSKDWTCIQKELETARADIAISVNYPNLIPDSVIHSIPMGILNAHGGDLPRYRGNACQAWAILNAEPRIGLCIHKMVGGELDSGDIIAREYLDIDIDTKVTRVWNWMDSRIPVLFVDAINRLEADSGFVLEVQSKDPDSALRCYPRLPEDGRINWILSAADILRLINASNKPYAGAYCEFRDTRVRIWDAELYTVKTKFCAMPGQVVEIHDESVAVACGEGLLLLKEIETEKHITNPAELLSSIRFRLH